MRVFRRVILPAAWLAVFAVIAVALVKIAFVDGLEPERTVAGPGAQVATPVIQASRATLTNRVEIKATVQSDAAVGVRNSTAGQVTYIFLEPGAKVAMGDRLYQVRSEVQPAPAVAADPVTEAGPQGSSASRQPLPAAPLPAYTYTDVVAPASGVLETLDVLINQQVSVGETAGSVDPGTFTVSGTVDAAQQYRLLAKPGSAQVALVGGPAPFTCPAVVLESAAAAAAGGPGAGVTGGTGGVSRSVPYAQADPGTAAGAPEQGGTPTGTLSCAVPSSVEVFAGLGATMTVTAGEAVNVVTVPLTAVEGSVKEGIVWLAGTGPAPGAGGAVVDGSAGPGAAEGVPAGVPAGGPASEPEQRKVQLGLNDGSRVEVVSGLAEGEAILEFIPGAPAQVPPGQQFGPGFPMGG
ncbi:hypothetical protein ACFVYC_12160 [Pseudarthrobacter sp. NPDC058329]|uniref:hypothetical protein n=1 Tax=Pseudarthrobacter sp. NPDC058329 TaxID=3346448 RepID=UPI0036D77C51